MKRVSKSRRALLLDAGNTVVFLDHAAVGTIAGLSAAAVRDAEPEAKRRYAARLQESGDHEDGWRLFVRTLLETAGARGDLDVWVDRLREAHDELNLWRRVPDDLPRALRRIRETGWAVGIVSNSEGRLPELFDVVGLGDEFEVIVDSHNVGVAKPDPEIFHIALRALGVRAEDTVYAGDIPEVDVEGARAAGIEGVLIDPLGHYADFSPRHASVAALVDTLLRP